jgi:hypothetical protein
MITLMPTIAILNHLAAIIYLIYILKLFADIIPHPLRDQNTGNWTILMNMYKY